MSTQLRSITNSALGYNSSQAHAYAEPQRRATPDQDSRRTPTPTFKARADADRSILKNTGPLLLVAGIIGFAFLNGRIQLAREAHRSIMVARHLNQAINMEHEMENRQARLITPTTIGNKAASIGMAHPDEA